MGGVVDSVVGAVGGLLGGGGGGGGSAKADTAAFQKSLDESSAARTASASATTDASNSAARVASQLGANINDAAKANFDEQTAFNKPLLDAQSQAAQAELAQGQKNLAAFDEEGRPLQKMIRDDAMGIITPEKQQLMDTAAGTAIADARNGTTQQQNMIMRQGARFGFSADKLADMGGTAAAAGASAQVAAANAGRMQAGDKFTANINSAYKTYADQQTSGANLINSGTNTSATGAGIKQATAAQYIQGLSTGSTITQNGQAQKLNGLGAVLNSNTSTYGADASSRSGVTNANTSAAASIQNAEANAKGEMMGALVGGAASIGAVMI